MDKNCNAKHFCKQYQTSGVCPEICILYNNLEFIYEYSNIPKRYRYYIPIDHSSGLAVQERYKEIVADIEDWVNNGKDLYLCGATGTGKTLISTSIMNAYIRRRSQLVDPENAVYFMSTTRWLDTLRNSINSHGAYEDLMWVAENSDLLIIDDLGAERITEWARERLFIVIDYRYAEDKRTIYTSNCDIETLTETLGDRIVSRLRSCEMLHLKGYDRRGINV